MFFSLTKSVSAELVSQKSTNFQNNFSLLTSRCKYVFGAKNTSVQIAKSSARVTDKVISLDFYISMKLDRRKICGKLSFSCFTLTPVTPRQNIVQKITAADEIALEDAGGRYARVVVWQRGYEGKGWNGTVAYVNSIYGDQERRNIPDYFLICPNKNGLTCFSFEIAKVRLDKKESDRIPHLLEKFEISDFSLTSPG